MSRSVSGIGCCFPPRIGTGEMDGGLDSLFVETGASSYEGPVAKLNRSFRCDVCEYSTPYKSNLNRHLQRHNASKNVHEFGCDQCSKIFRSKFGLRLHQSNTHSKEYRFTCDVCQRGFNMRSHYNGHIASHNDTFKSQCPHCDRTFQYKKNMKDHIATNHGDPQQMWQKRMEHKCDICGSEYQSKNAKREHVMAMHKGKVHVCQKCGREFKWRSSLKYHLKVCPTAE